jgi:mono/diheme cytochrome c family protein
MMRRLGSVCGIAALVSLFGAGAYAQGDAARVGQDAGQRLAFSVCAACHVVSPSEAAEPKLQPPAPSFAEIADSPGVTATSLRAFLAIPHATGKTPPNMPSMLLSDEETTAVVRYILSLRTGR